MKLTTIAATTIDTASGHSLGIDVVVRPSDGQVILRSMLGDWPKGWVEHARYGRPKSLHHAWVLPQWQPQCDFFVFRDAAIHQSWSMHGITRGNVHHIICVTISKDQLGFIVSDERSHSCRVALNAIDAVKSSHAASDLPPRLFAEPRFKYQIRRWHKRKNPSNSV